MEEDVVSWAVEVDESARSFARCFTRHGNGRLAAAEVGYKRPASERTACWKGPRSWSPAWRRSSWTGEMDSRCVPPSGAS